MSPANRALSLGSFYLSSLCVCVGVAGWGCTLKDREIDGGNDVSHGFFLCDQGKKNRSAPLLYETPLLTIIMRCTPAKRDRIR